MYIVAEKCSILTDYILFLHLFKDLPAAAIPSSTILASTGEPVTLLCVVSNVLDITSVEWTKAHHGVTQNNISWGNSRYIGGTISSPSLSINNVVHSDEGYYTCTVTNIQGTSFLQQQLYLYITESMLFLVMRFARFWTGKRDIVSKSKAYLKIRAKQINKIVIFFTYIFFVYLLILIIENN